LIILELNKIEPFKGLEGSSSVTNGAISPNLFCSSWIRKL